MRTELLALKAIVSATLLGGASLLASGSAAAQVGVVITPDQERIVYMTLLRERVWPPPPPGVVVAVGAEIPREIELNEVPTSIEIAPVRRYRYTVLNEQVVLVDPASRQIVRVIRGAP